MVNVYKQLGLGTDIHNPMTDNTIHSMGAMFVDDLDLYTWKEDITNPAKLMMQAQREVSQWSLLLNTTGGTLKPKKCFRYLLDYTCEDGEWEYKVHSDFELYVNNLDRSRSGIKQEETQTLKKTLGIYDSPAGGNQGHLDYIHGKLTKWINRMTNGHLPSHMAWIAYRLQLWPGLCYGLGTMINNLEATETIFDKVDYEIMNSGDCTHGKKRTLEVAHYLQQIQFIPPSHGTIDMQNQHATTTLPHINRSEQEIRCFLLVPPVATGHSP
jgi:hypothetical protein